MREYRQSLIMLGSLALTVVAWYQLLSGRKESVVSGSLAVYLTIDNALVILFLIFLAIELARAKDISLIITAICFVITFLLIVGSFSLTYWSYGSTPNFNVNLTRLDALYFAIGTLSTAGTGTINATSELMREIQAVQMVLDTGLMVFAIGLLVARLSSGSDRRPNRSSKH